MKPLFVTATGTGIGKTYTMLQLMRFFSARGVRVLPFKPVETGVKSTPQDATALLACAQACDPALSDLTPEQIAPVRFGLPAAPFVAKGDVPLDLERIETQFSALKKRCDLLLIEGAGGLMVPLEEDFFMIDLIIHLEAYPLLVTHDRLGCINDTLLSLSLLEQRGMAYDWCVNLRDPESFDRLSRPFFERRFGALKTVQDLERWAPQLPLSS